MEQRISQKETHRGGSRWLHAGLLAALMTVAMQTLGQTYVGTMTIGAYRQEQVEVTMQRTKTNACSLTMHRVKFAKAMPVRVDVGLAPVAVEGTKLRAAEVVPTSNGREKKKRTVKGLEGMADSDRLSFSCLMGGQRMTFSGRRQP